MLKYLLVLASAAAMVSAACAQNIEKLEWKAGQAASESSEPDTFYPAEVPGAVQLDFAKALKYPDWRYADNSKVFMPMEDKFYVYESRFPKLTLPENSRLLFFCENIDYRYKIYFNGELIADAEGMQTPVEADITDLQKAENLLKVVIFPTPKATLKEYELKKMNFGNYRSYARESTKAAVSYGWDFQPRLIPLGISGQAGLIIADKSRITNVRAACELSEDLSLASITLEADGENLKGRKYEWRLLDADGKVAAQYSGVFTADSLSEKVAEIKSPKLWWPNGYGTPYLYKSELTLVGGAEKPKTQNVGFRRIRLVPNEGAWKFPNTYEKSRSVPAMQFEVNGRRIFAKGSNFVSPEIFYSDITSERYAELVEIAVQMNLNILRIWGGAPAAKESFYDFCDARGILVWQEFPLSCNRYPDDAHYLKVLKREAESIVKRLRRHPCLAYWSGGNELFNSWSRMTEQSAALRMLNAVTFSLDPNTPFNYTSPLMGAAHGPYWFMLPVKSPKCDVFEYFPKLRYTAYCEFGVSSMSPVSTLEKVIPAGELFPVRETTAYMHHCLFWDNSPRRQLNGLQGNMRAANLYCGEPKDLEDQVEKTQFIQAQALGFIFEEARRQKPYCSTVMNWCFNDTWPAAANLSVIAYPAVKKQAFYTIKNACRPFIISARPAKFVWKSGEKFSARLFALNDSYDAVGALKVSVKIGFDGRVEKIGEWSVKDVPAYENVEGGDVFFDIPTDNASIKRFALILEVEGHPEYSSKYFFVRNDAFAFPKDN